MRSRSTVVVAGLVAAVAMAFFAFTALGSGDGGGAPRPLLVLGDSLCAGARDDGADMTGTLRAEGWEPEYACGDGVPIDRGIEYVRTRAEVPYDVVVALGTNGGQDEAGFDAKLASLRNELVARGAGYIVWVDFATRDGGYAAKNLALWRFAETHGDALAAWSERAAGSPHLFQPDAVHHTVEGSVAWVEGILEALGDPGDRAASGSASL